MPTAALLGLIADKHLRAVADVGHLVLGFRASAVRRRSAFRWSEPASCSWSRWPPRSVPAYTPGAGGQGQSVRHPAAAADRAGCLPRRRGRVGDGGARRWRPRELLGREASAIAYPISPTTDHLGALLLSPLNIAWLLQAWIAARQHGVRTGAATTSGSPRLRSSVLLWVATVDRDRRRRWPGGSKVPGAVPHGVIGIRALVVGLLGAVLGLQVSGNLLDAVLTGSPTRQIVIGMVTGFDVRLAADGAGPDRPASPRRRRGRRPGPHLAAHRIPPRRRLRVETRHLCPARRPPRNDLTRPDRAPTAGRSGGRCRCAAASRCWPLAPVVVALLGGLQWLSR